MGRTARDTNPNFINGVPPELLIIRLLEQGEMYGYELVQTIRDRTGESIVSVKVSFTLFYTTSSATGPSPPSGTRQRPQPHLLLPQPPQARAASPTPPPVGPASQQPTNKSSPETQTEANMPQPSPDPTFIRLRERLPRAGIAPRHVRRYVSELTAHLADLTTEEQSRGLPLANVRATALTRLGSIDALPQTMTAQPQF